MDGGDVSCRVAKDEPKVGTQNCHRAGREEDRPDTQSVRYELRQLKQKGQLELGVTRLRRKLQGGSWLQTWPCAFTERREQHPIRASQTCHGRRGTWMPNSTEPSALLRAPSAQVDCLAKKAGEKLGKAVTSRCLLHLGASLRTSLPPSHTDCLT